MKLIFGDSKSIRIRDDYIKSWYYRNISLKLEDAVDVMRQQVDRCGCDMETSRHIPEHFDGDFEIILREVNEGLGRLIWDVFCGFFEVCKARKTRDSVINPT